MQNFSRTYLRSHQCKSSAARLLPVSAFALVLAITGAARGADVSALVGEENGDLDILDITTGTSTVLSQIGSQYNGLAFNSNESVVYGVTAPQNGAATELVIVDKTTGANTPVAAIAESP